MRTMMRLVLIAFCIGGHAYAQNYEPCRHLELAELKGMTLTELETESCEIGTRYNWMKREAIVNNTRTVALDMAKCRDENERVNRLLETPKYTSAKKAKRYLTPFCTVPIKGQLN